MFVLRFIITENNGMDSLSKISGILFTVFLCNCAPQGQINDNKDLILKELISEPIAPPVELLIKKIPTETLYDLLVGDIALGRNQLDIALQKYSYQAQLTNDPATIRLAFLIAHNQNAQETKNKLLSSWLLATPKDPDAHRAALDNAVAANDPFTALIHGGWLYQNYDDLDSLLQVAQTKPQSDQDILSLVSQISEMPFSLEKELYKELFLAILYQQNDQIKKAEISVRAFLQRVQGNIKGTLLLSQLLHKQGKDLDAIYLLENTIIDHPSSRPIRLQYARFLSIKFPKESIVQFKSLSDDDPNDQHTRYLLALMYLSQNNLDMSSQLFNITKDSYALRSDSFYHLGVISDRLNRPQQAIDFYSQVKLGTHYLGAVTRSSKLLAETTSIAKARKNLKQLRILQPEQSINLFLVESNLLLNFKLLKDATKLLSEALAIFPNDLELLYARSMLAEQQNDFALAEQDLRRILNQDENNAAVLNALGYTMLLHTDRTKEAYDFILRAYDLNPRNPAIIDSLGWALFNLGQKNEALGYLQEAYKLAPDPEIAAHLGEVNWSLGMSNKALEVWQNGLSKKSNDGVIENTMRRLGVCFGDKCE